MDTRLCKCLSEDTDSDQKEYDVADTSVLDQYNKTMGNTSQLAGAQAPPKLTFQLDGNLESAAPKEKDECITRATDACKRICKIIAPDDGEKLFEALQQDDNGKSLVPLMTAYAQAPSRSLIILTQRMLVCLIVLSLVAKSRV